MDVVIIANLVNSPCSAFSPGVAMSDQFNQYLLVCQLELNFMWHKYSNSLLPKLSVKNWVCQRHCDYVVVDNVIQWKCVSDLRAAVDIQDRSTAKEVTARGWRMI